MTGLKIGLIKDCASVEESAAWLADHHASTPEVSLRFAKKDSGAVRVSRSDALEVALCYGWIDGQARSTGR